jgi:predicted RNase H-like HicB family nuclease
MSRINRSASGAPRSRPKRTVSARTPSRRASGDDRFVISISVTPLTDGRYLGRSPELPGLNVQGRTAAEVLKLAPAVARDLIAAMRHKGVPLPPKLSEGDVPKRVRMVVAA